LKNDIECYNYHNFGLKDANFHLKNYKEDPRIKFLIERPAHGKGKIVKNVV
jgi:hypothetical protein